MNRALGPHAALLLLLWALLAMPAPSRAAAPADPSDIPVFVALELLAGPGTDVAAREVRLERFVAALQSSGRIRVLEATGWSPDVLGDAAAREALADLRVRALHGGARYVVLASATLLAGRESWDLQLLAIGSGPEYASAMAGDPAEAGARAAGELLALAALHGRGRGQQNGGAGPPTSSLEDLERAVEQPPEDAQKGLAPGVVEVRIEGQRRIDADAIRAVLRTRAGERLDTAVIAGDIRRIYELGFFRDVQVLASALRGGMLITFRVEENPVIRRVTLTGNESMGSDDIKEKLTLTVGSTVDYPLILENQQRIEAIYQGQGYYEVEVSYAIEPLSEGGVSVDYDLVEGRKLRLREIDFEGNTALDDKELEKDLQTKPWGWTSLVSHYWDNSGLYAEPIFYQDLDRISRNYMDQGFIRVKVGEPEVEVNQEGLAVRVVIEEGPQYRVGSIDVLGDETIDRTELMEAVEMTPGDVFSRTTLSDDVERLRARYANRGFYQARVRPRTDVDPDKLTVDVIFEVEKNELFFVDWIKVAGNTRTRDEVVRREIGLAEGELYSDGTLQRSRARVQRLGFFEEVNVRAEPVGDENVGVTIDVVERPTGSFSFGAGVASQDGFLVNAAVRQENLFGRAWSVSLSTDVGTDNQFGSLRFRNPAFLGTSVGFGVGGQYSERKFSDFDQEILGFSVDLSYPLDEGETDGTVGYALSRRRVSGFSSVEAASMLQREEFQEETSTSLLTLSARRDTRDDVRFPREGHIVGVAAEFAGLGGISNFVRLESRGTWFWPIDDYLGFESTFVVNTRVGYVFDLNSIADFDLPTCPLVPIPGSDCDAAQAEPEVAQISAIDDDLKLTITERYFLGGLGPFQLRGFEQRSLGPRRAFLKPLTIGSNVFTTSDRADGGLTPGVPGTCPVGECNTLEGEDNPKDYANLDLTDVIGGNKMFLLNLEVQFPISDELGLLGNVFLDMGNAFAEDQFIDPSEFRFGTGFGTTWFSPFGPIQLTLGFPLDRLEIEDSMVFEFSLGGQAF